MVLPKIRLNRLRLYHFVDIEDIDIGSLEDVALDKKSLIPTHLILGSNFFEELLEEMGKKANIDEIAPLDLVEEIDGDHVIIGKPVDELEQTDENAVLPSKYKVYKYSDLSQFKVEDEVGESEADLIDLEFEGDKSRLIFNFPTLHRDLMMEGYMQRFEVAYLVDQITVKGKKIHLPSSNEKLKENVKKDIQPLQRGKSTIFW